MSGWGSPCSRNDGRHLGRWRWGIASVRATVVRGRSVSRGAQTRHSNEAQVALLCEVDSCKIDEEVQSSCFREEMEKSTARRHLICTGSR
jgi:hypothetical protein